jgi:hypothetical protein
MTSIPERIYQLHAGPMMGLDIDENFILLRDGHATDRFPTDRIRPALLLPTPRKEQPCVVSTGSPAISRHESNVP